jgi:NAD(P)-dependent dehydrogenase (short-subunit alcohol dehydrogenase family)
VTREGGRGVAAACDHRDDEQVAALFERVAKDEGRLDILVNNAFIVVPEITSGLPFWQTPISNWDDMIDVGLRSAYVASWHAARLMVPRASGFIANISSSGARQYAWHVVYGVGKCALDRVTADTAVELGPKGVSVVSLWPGLVLTERMSGLARASSGLDFSKAESSRFTGRAVAALAQDPDVQRFSGTAVSSRQMADEYGHKDVDGSLPDGPLEHRPTQASAAIE